MKESERINSNYNYSYLHIKKAIQDIEENENELDNEIQTVAEDVGNLQETVGDSENGLVKDVEDLQETVGDSESGLVKDVNYLKNPDKKYNILYNCTASFTGETATHETLGGEMILWFKRRNETSDTPLTINNVESFITAFLRVGRADIIANGSIKVGTDTYNVVQAQAYVDNNVNYITLWVIGSNSYLSTISITDSNLIVGSNALKGTVVEEVLQIPQPVGTRKTTHNNYINIAIDYDESINK